MQIDPLNPPTKVAALDTVRNNQDPVIPRQLVTAVRALNKSELYGQDRQLQFSRDTQANALVIKIVQPSTGDVVEQLPPEAVLQAYKDLQELEAKDTYK